MGYSCVGQMLADWINGSLGSFTFSFIDENGLPHTATAYPSLLSDTQSMVLIFDGSSDSYVATAVRMTYSNCGTVWEFPISQAKTPYIAIGVAVTLVITPPNNAPPGISLYPFTIPALELLVGSTPLGSFSGSASATQITYSATTTSSGATICSSTVSSTSTVSPSSITYIGSGDTLTINANFSYGSCQQLENATFSFTFSSFNSGNIPACPYSPCYSAECNYDQSCSTIAQIQIIIS